MQHDHPLPHDVLPVEALGLDEDEIGMLAVLRHFLTAFTRPETQAWQSAFTIASERWGETRGPQVATGLLAVLHAVRHARMSDFRYTNPLCMQCRQTATPEEASLMLMLHAMRRDRADRARPAVLDLAEGMMDAALVQSGLSFAARFPAELDLGGAFEERPRQRPSTMPQQNGPRPQRRMLRLVH